MTKSLESGGLEDLPLPSSAGIAVDCCIARLREIVGRSAARFAYEVGTAVIDAFFGGDTAAYRDKNHASRPSLRLLAQDPRLPMSATTLWRCLKIYDLLLHVENPNRWTQLSQRHFRAVLGARLPVAARIRLLDAADESEWSTRELEMQVRDTLDASHPRPQEPQRRWSALRRADHLATELAQHVAELMRVAPTPEGSVAADPAIASLLRQLESTTAMLRKIAANDSTFPAGNDAR